MPDRANVHIRPAVLDDWPTIVDFNCCLASETEHLELHRPTVELGVRAALSDVRKARYYVAEAEERIVGQLMHTWEWSDWRNGHIWWLQSVYVHPEYRRRGVFRQLLEHVQHLAATDPAVVGMRLYVEQENNPARQVYRRFGLQDTGYLVLEKL